MSVKKIHLFPSEESYVANSGSIEADDVALVPLNLSYNILEDKPEAHITTTWHVGTSWYREWSDGWIEQGGRVTTSTATTTISFNAAFKDTNYTITVSQNGSSGSRVAISARDTSNFTIAHIENAMLPFSWFACGY